MYCNNTCRLCNNLVISTAIAYDSATNTLNITIPNNSYRCNDKVCIVVAQSIPETTTINAQVYIFVGQSSFPLVNKNCTPVIACQIRSRTKYATCVKTTSTSGSFRLLYNLCNSNQNNLIALPVVESATPTPTIANVKKEGTNNV